ncbi:MAG TPA: helix-turn-helix domain-containing protein [Acidimicrobiales bacterium]|nr:helix-turn-helix domain-containing protein [Acidimicrobiales bacterium]
MSAKAAPIAATGTDDPGPDAIACSVARAAGLLEVSRPTMYQLLMSGKVHSVKVGARRLVSVASLRAFVDGEPVS